MKKGTKIGLIVAGSIAAIVGGYFLFRRKQKKELLDTSIPDLSVSSQTRDCVIFPLKKGSGYSSAPCSNKQVQNLQIVLNTLSYAPLLPLKVDGKFGQMTEDRLDRLYQTKQVSEELYNKMINSAKGIK